MEKVKEKKSQDLLVFFLYVYGRKNATKYQGRLSEALRKSGIIEKNLKEILPTLIRY